jgi:hypothetical protein
LSIEPRNFAAAPYRGYEYQILATVYVGLDLVIARHVTESVSIEPASGEDIAADLIVDPEHAQATVGFTEGDRNIQIQIKLRQTGHWTEAAFRDVLIAGTSADNATKAGLGRIRPIDYLTNNPNSLFVFITNAQVNSQLSDFRIDKFEQRSKATALPEKCPGNAGELSPRIGILEQLTPEVLQSRIRDLLGARVRVPSRYMENCVDALINAVRERLLGRRPNEWTRTELVSIIGANRGYPDQGIHSRLVKPLNYDSLQSKLSTNHALLLVGTPGSGKSLVSEGLLLDSRLNGYDLVRIDPTAAPNIQTLLEDIHKTVFYLEDPWGSYRVEEYALKWINELPKLLQRASETKKFLITSRSGIAKSAFGTTVPMVVSSAEAVLTEKDYDDTARSRILDNEITGAPPDQRDFVDHHRSHILNKLRNPYALSMFAKRLRVSTHLPDIDEIIQESQTEFIGNTLAKEVKAGGRRAVISGGILWLLFMMGKVSLTNAAALREYAIAGGIDPADVDPRGLLQTLLAAGWFESIEEKVRAHPTQIQGLESLLQESATQTEAEDALQAVLQGFVKGGKLKAATRAVRQLVSRKLPIPMGAQAAIDRFVVAQCVNAISKDFPEALEDVARLSKGDDPVSLVAQAIIPPPKANSHGFGLWIPPDWDEPTIQAVRTSSDARRVAACFLKYSLPRHNVFEYAHSKLIEFLFSTLEWNLSAESEEGFDDALKYGNVDFEPLLEGAMRAVPAPYSRLLDKALAALDEISQAHSEPNEEYRQAEQAELDAAHCDYIIERPSDDYFVPTHAIALILKTRRSHEGFTWILSHARRNDLLDAWGATLSAKTSKEELEAFWTAARPTRPQLAWRAFREARARELRQRLLDDVGNTTPEDCNDLLRSIAGVLTNGDWTTDFLPSVAGLPFDRRLLIAHHLTQISDDDEHEARIKKQTVMAMFSDEEKPLASAALFGISEALISSLPVDQLHTLAQSTIPNVAFVGIGLLAAQGVAEGDALKRLMGNGNESVRATAASIAEKGLFRSLKESLRASLTDTDYRVRRAAMNSFAAHADDSDWTIIASMAKDRSGPVRETCAELIGRYHRGNEAMTLVDLLNDRRNNNAQTGIFKPEFVGGPNYHVARAAAKSIGELYEFSDEVEGALITFLRGREERCDDVVVRYEAMQSLTRFEIHNLELVLSEFLLDNQHAPGMKNPGYPVRYAAAWGLVERLQHHSQARQNLNPNVLVEPALHTDGRVAGPCLLALGLLYPRSSVECGNALPVGTSRFRAALVRLGTAMLANQNLALPSNITATKALEDLLAKIQSAREWAYREWQLFLSGQAEITAWLEGVKNAKDVGDSVLWALGQICPNLFDTKAGQPHAQDLPQVLGVVSMRTLTGGE